MNGQNIIDEFDKLTDEMSELTAAQKLALANTKYRHVANDRDWEWLRNEGSVTIASSEIDLSGLSPSFRNFAENNNTKYRFGFWIGTRNSASFYEIINMQDRWGRPDLSYFDLANSKIVLADGLNLNGQAAKFDYFARTTALAVGTSPVFNSDYHQIIPYLMAAEHYDIDQTEASRSKKDEYNALADDILENMQYEDDQFKENWLTH